MFIAVRWDQMSNGCPDLKAAIKWLRHFQGGMVRRSNIKGYQGVVCFVDKFGATSYPQYGDNKKINRE